MMKGGNHVKLATLLMTAAVILYPQEVSHTTESPQVSTAYPWVFPGDFRERLRMSDVVVSGIVIYTSRAGTRTVNSTEVTSNIARVRVDRVFQGTPSAEELQFTWFSPHSVKGGGFLYSGPPLAAFDQEKRYLIFLKRTGLGWEVAMPLYALEVELATELPRAAARDLSLLPLQQRYESLAGELETLALAQPPPPSGTTGMAATTFSAVFDLLGGCAEPFYSHFLSVPSPELRVAAMSWLELIQERHLKCDESVRLEKLQ
jgi:hypothetical protein